MMAKPHAKKVINFPLRPISRRPHASNAVDALSINRNLQTHTLVCGDRIEIVSDFKRRFLAIRIVNASQVRKIIERRVAIAAERLADFYDVRRFDANRKLTEKLRSFN